MKKLVFVLIGLVVVNFCFGQNLPTIIPSSPNAFQMTKYGDIPVNESTGEIGVKIPLTNYEAGMLSLPITANYSGNGVKTNQESSIIGMNWTLQAGGVITRIVRDKIDELTSQKFFLSEDEINNIPSGNFESRDDPNTFIGKMYLLGTQANTMTCGGCIDTQADIFNYSLPGFSGSFFFDAQMNAHLIKYDKEIKISTFYENSKLNFKITTIDGINYFFGGLNATEITRNRWGMGPNASAWVPTSFYLYKITSWNGNEIYLNYNKITTSNFNVNTSYNFSRTHGFRANTDIILPYIYSNNFSLSTTNNITFYKNDEKLILDKISSNCSDDYMIFNLNTSFGASLTTKRKILVYSKLDVLAKQVEFTLKKPYSNYFNKFFLKSIKFLDSNNNYINSGYNFDYDQLDQLPNYITKAVDHLGYYNGKTSNVNLIPDNIDSDIIPNDLIESFKQYQGQMIPLADREADFSFAKIGSLMKITYPSKGYTLFEYESGQDGLKRAFDSASLSLEYIKDGTSSNDIVTTTSSFTPNKDGIATVIFNTSSSNSITSGFILANIEIEDATNGTIIDTKYLAVGNPTAQENPPIIHNNKYTFAVENGHQYNVTLYFSSDTQPDSNHIFDLLYADTYLTATATITYPILGPPKDALGIRVKKIISKDNPNGLEKIKRYYYHRKEVAEDKVIKVSPNSFIYHNYEIVSLLQAVHYPWQIPHYPPLTRSFVTFSSKINIFSNNLGIVFENDNNQRLYPVVTISYGGDNFEKGGEELFFKVSKRTSPQVYYAPLYNIDNFTPVYDDEGYQNFYDFEQLETLIGNLNEKDTVKFFSAKIGTNTNWENGTMYKRILFKKENGQLETLKKIEKIYKTDETKSFTNHNVLIEKFSGMDLQENISGWLINPLTNLKIGLYDTYSKWHALDTLKITNYFENDSIQTYKKYFYDNGWAGIPTRVISETSTGTQIEKKMYYPDQINSISTLGGGNLTLQSFNAIEILKSNQQYRIANPIQTEIYKNSLLLTRNRTDYKIENGLSLPEKISESVGNNVLEDKLIYHKYDSYGNPLEVSKKDGTHICYVWGYNHSKPVAKIVGVNYASIPISQLNSVINFDYTNGSESNLLSLLTQLRNSLPEASVTTLTYKPLIGVSTITDPKGDTQYFTYDNFNRLKYVKDKYGNILKENQYHYRP